MAKQTVITRNDLCTISQFAAKFHVTRAKVYALIAEDLLAERVISFLNHNNPLPSFILIDPLMCRLIKGPVT